MFYFYQPGVVGAIAYRGETLLSVGYGTIKKGSKTVPNADTIFRIGSITKVFVVSGNYHTAQNFDGENF